MAIQDQGCVKIQKGTGGMQRHWYYFMGKQILSKELKDLGVPLAVEGDMLKAMPGFSVSVEDAWNEKHLTVSWKRVQAAAKG